MSVDNHKPSIKKALKLGACHYWTKPLHDNQFESMWNHVFKKYISENKMQKDLGSIKAEDDDKIREISDNPQFGLSYDNLDESSTRKNRVVWSPELHDAFLKAIEVFGIESTILRGLFFFIRHYLYFYADIITFLDYFLLDATPKKILEAMKIHGLERGHVASHLQVSFYLHFLLIYFIITPFFSYSSLLSLFSVSVYPFETKCNLSTRFHSDIG